MVYEHSELIGLPLNRQYRLKLILGKGLRSYCRVFGKVEEVAIAIGVEIFELGVLQPQFIIDFGYTRHIADQNSVVFIALPEHSLIVGHMLVFSHEYDELTNFLLIIHRGARS